MATRIPRRHRWTPLPLLILFAGISPATAGDPADYTYRSSTTEIRLNFSAMDQNDRGVATLQANDFAIVDKDVIVRNFQSFTRSDWTKLEIAILIDSSESVTPHFRREMADALGLISQSTGIPDENISMFSFQDRAPLQLCAGDCRTSHALEDLPTARVGSLTPLYDSIITASDFLSQRGDPHAQKILILFSDGVDTISRRSLRDAVDAALADDVQMECIDLNPRSSFAPGSQVLRALAAASGGRYFPPPNGAAAALNVILEGFRASYAVSYKLPSHSSGFHTVRILPTKNLNLQFRSRSGYYYPDRIR